MWLMRCLPAAFLPSTQRQHQCRLVGCLSFSLCVGFSLLHMRLLRRAVAFGVISGTEPRHRSLATSLSPQPASPSSPLAVLPDVLGMERNQHEKTRGTVLTYQSRLNDKVPRTREMSCWRACGYYSVSFEGRIRVGYDQGYTSKSIYFVH